ncbi:hypothetical protein C9975_03465 [Thalassospira xiamenensis]|nr:hypothetical protein C9975_03465 [Thalassospira xiamenensis]
MIEDERKYLQSVYRHIYEGGEDFWLSGPTTDNPEFLRIKNMDKIHLKNAMKRVKNDRSYIESEFGNRYKSKENKDEFVSLAEKKIAAMQSALANKNIY